MFDINNVNYESFNCKREAIKRYFRNLIGILKHNTLNMH